MEKLILLIISIVLYSTSLFADISTDNLCKVVENTYVWSDNNCNGIQDPDETGIPGITVTLIYPDGLTETTITNTEGLYTFDNLSTGLYTITVGDGPDGSILSTSGSIEVDLDEGKDYINTSFGFCVTVTEIENEYGCTDSTACNYNPNATIYNGSCDYGNTDCPDNPCDPNSCKSTCGVSIINILTCECDGQITVELLADLINGSNQWFFELFDDSGELMEQNATLYPPINFKQLCIGDYSLKVTGIAGEVENCVQEFAIALSNCDKILGCTDPIACNYDPDATTDNGSCEFGNIKCPTPCNAIIGCPDIAACNYLPDANCADSTLCDYGSTDCPDNPCYPSKCEGACGVSVTTIPTCECDGQITVEISEELLYRNNQWFFELFDGSGELIEQNATRYPPLYFEQLCAENYSIKVTGIAGQVEGCMQEFEIELSNCGVSGCTDLIACNYDPEATTDDGTCEFGDISCLDPCNCDCETPALFIKYPFLNDLLDPCNCYNQSVKEYDLGSFAYVSVIIDAKLRLFFEDGTLYCNSSTTFDCISLYDLNGKETDAWDCPNTQNPICNPYNDYPWLSDLLPKDECYGGTEINVYNLGAYSFVEIIEGEIEKLYLEDGTYYCTNEYGISCKSFYGLIPECLTCNYTCPNNDSISERLGIENNSDLDFKIFPNPSNGQFKLLLPYFGESSAFIKIYDIQGQLITMIDTIEEIAETNFSVNLQDYNNGIYFIEISNGYKSKVKRLIIQR